jgi:hypothetical protein
MKTGFFLTLAFAVLAGSASAQQMKKTKSLEKDEVPVLVQQSLQRDFSNLTEKGEWKLTFIQDVSTKTSTPEFYTYTSKNNGEKVEIFYKADGTLDHTKGIAAPTQSSQR